MLKEQLKIIENSKIYLTGFTGFFGLFCCSASFLMKLTESNQPAAEIS